MSRPREMTFDVYLHGWMVIPEAGADIVDHVVDGVCPVCNYEGETMRLPKPDDIGKYNCPDCGLEVIVEARWV